MEWSGAGTRWCSGLPENFSSFPSVRFLGGLGNIFLSAFHAWVTADWCGSQAVATTAQLPTPGTVPFLPSPVLLPFGLLLQLATYRHPLPLKSSRQVWPGGRQVGCCLDREEKLMMSFGSFHLTLRKLRDLGWHLPRSPTSPFAEHSLRPHVTLLSAQAHTPSASLCSPGLRHCPLLNLTAPTLSSLGTTWLPTGSERLTQISMCWQHTDPWIQEAANA